MAYNGIKGFPPQQLSFRRKNKIWRQRCVDFGDNYSFQNSNLSRKSTYQMRINYDLINGKLHMDDIKSYLNPYGLDASFIPDSVQHYPIINSKFNVLRGEESERLFDYRVTVTNPNAISEIEEEKNSQVNAMLQQLIQESSSSEDEFNYKLEKMSDYFKYEYQDKREIRANRLLNHYVKELGLKQLFNDGIIDAEVVGEEIYQVDIVGGEPVVKKLDPMKVRIIRSGNSNKVEDADMIVIEDYWSPGQIIDTFWDQGINMKMLEEEENTGLFNSSDDMDNIDERDGFVLNTDGTLSDDAVDVNSLFDYDFEDARSPYDTNGNIRVLRVYWKSRRKIKKVKSYDPETGEEEFNFYPENYSIDTDKGEEEETFWINEAWEGTKIGKDIYVNIRPRPVQYNRMSNPSRCHFGIIGSIYSINNSGPYSIVDMAKPYAYMYDICHDQLQKLLAKNIGKVIRMDFSKIPDSWDTDKWLYYLKVNGIAVEDSFNEGKKGMATGKLAGAMNNASSGVIDASLGNDIMFYISVLQFIDTQIGKMMGISPQREGQVSNRETVGGVERANLQSSYITQWIFSTHDDVKKRVLETVLETAKICLKGRKKKFSYIVADNEEKFAEIDGDEFAECDYGLVVDNDNMLQQLNQKLDTLAQAALQNQKLNFSSIMKLYTTTSLAEKQRMIEAFERHVEEQQMQQQQQQLQIQQQQMQTNLQMAREKQQMDYQMHREDVEAKVLTAQINSRAEDQRYAMMNNDSAVDNDQKERKLSEQIRQFDERMKQQADKLNFDMKKHDDEVKLKERQMARSNTQSKS